MKTRLAVIVLALTLMACDDDPTSPSPVDEGIETLRDATDRYKDVQTAVADGFQPVPACEDPDGPGALGVPYLNADRLDTTIDLENPEVLFYEPQENGDLELVGVEMVVPIDAWEQQESETPSVLGQEFHKNEEAGLYGIHVWVWRDNPEGVFAFAHPNVSCQYDAE